MNVNLAIRKACGNGVLSGRNEKDAIMGNAISLFSFRISISARSVFDIEAFRTELILASSTISAVTLPISRSPVISSIKTSIPRKSDSSCAL